MLQIRKVTPLRFFFLDLCGETLPCKMYPSKIMNAFTLSPDRFRTDPLLHSLINGYDPRSQLDAVGCKKTCQEWHIKGRLSEAHFEIESFRGLVWGQQSFGILPLSHCFLLRWVSAQRCSGHCFILHVREPAKRDDRILERGILPMSHSFNGFCEPLQVWVELGGSVR